MRAVNIILILSVFALAGATSAMEVKSIGTVISMEGDVVDTSKDGTVRTLELKSPVYLNDTVVTKKQSKVQIMFLDDSVISQGENSEMTIDEYIYTPAKKEENAASVKMARGMFRTVAGKITELNPNRFKVKTRMATIGIRGCELGFRLGAMQEDIYILHLPEGKEIIIDKDLAVDEGLDIENIRNSMTVGDSGVLVAIRRGMGLESSEISAGEALQVFSDTSRIRSSDDDGGLDPGDTSKQMVDESEDIEDLAQLDRDIQDILNDLPPLPGGPDGDGAPSTSAPNTAPPAMVGGHPTNNDWEWGLWEDGTVVYYGNRYIGSGFVPDAEFANLVAGATAYNLNFSPPGTSVAGAVLTDLTDGSTVQLNGSCTAFNVTIPGSSGTPTWGTSINMGVFGPFGGGDALQFSANGTIDNGGVMSLSAITAYTMSVNGRNYVQSDLLTQSMSGRLVRPSSGTPVISGTVGEFHMTHADATVDGAFGADLQ